MPSASPGSKVRPEPASESSRWIVCLPERLPFRLTSSVISAGERVAPCRRRRRRRSVAKSTWMISRAPRSPPAARARRSATSSASAPGSSPRPASRSRDRSRSGRDAHGAELGQARVDAPADLAEVDVAEIAERQHAKRDALEARRVRRPSGLVELDRALRRVALAPGAGDHQQVTGPWRSRPGWSRPCRPALRQSPAWPRPSWPRPRPLGIAELGPEQDRERDLGAWRPAVAAGALSGSAVAAW